MYRILNRVGGAVRVRVSGADKEKFLNLCALEGAEPSRIAYVDSITLELDVAANQRMKAQRIAQRSHCSFEVLKSVGGTGAVQLALRRVSVVVAMLVMIALVFVSTAFIWEIDISGNETVTDGEILAALRHSGVAVGECWINLTSDNVRSEVVYRLPRLAWITVNIYGSRAEVIVRERVDKPEMYNDKSPCDIVAEKGGFVTGVMALSGRPTVKRGSAVMQGDKLISGAVNSPYGGVRAVHAFGSVRAMTYNELIGVMPTKVHSKNYTGEQRSLWSISLFGKRINFYGKGSISYANCDKINNVWVLGIDGLFALPVSITREKLCFYEINECEVDSAIAARDIGQQLREYLTDSMREGEILSENYTASKTEDTFCVCLRASCAEEIGTAMPMTDAVLSEIAAYGTNTEGE